MADALFDTTVFIDFYNGDPGAESVLRPVLDRAATASYSPVSTFEIWLGLSDPFEHIAFSGLLAGLQHAPLTDTTAMIAAGWMRGVSPRRAESIFRDALIAATAQERGETIVTRNTRDFARFNVKVRSY